MYTIEKSNDIVSLEVHPIYKNNIKITVEYDCNTKNIPISNLNVSCNILKPSGNTLIDDNSKGNYFSYPYAYFTPVKQTKVSKQTKVISINPEVSKRFNGKVALAILLSIPKTNIPISIGSYKPTLVFEYGMYKVKCEFKPDDESLYIYKYVIGVIVFDNNDIYISPSNKHPDLYSDADIKMSWNKDILPDINFK